MFNFQILFKILIILFISFNFAVSAKEKKRPQTYYKVSYIAAANEKLEDIILKFSKDGVRISNKNPSYQKTIKKSSKLNLTKIEKETVINLYISKEDFDKKKYRSYKKMAKKRLNEIQVEQQKVLEESSLNEEGFKFSVFYLATKGNFSQESSSGLKFDHSQNSLLSLGITASFHPVNKRYSFSSSMNYSHMGDASTSLQNQGNISIPGEIDFSAYAHYWFSKYNLSLFGGLDYDTFTTFNLGALTSQGKIVADENNVLYATVGINNLFKVFKQDFYTRVSISKSLNSKTNIGPSGTDPGTSYDGYKTLLYVNYKLTKSFFIHSLFKYHSMSGPDDLSTTRFGLGFGYLIN
jgi:hypothetical protein